jgi:hypothetical protein
VLESRSCPADPTVARIDQALPYPLAINSLLAIKPLLVIMLLLVITAPVPPTGCLPDAAVRPKAPVPATSGLLGVGIVLPDSIGLSTYAAYICRKEQAHAS